MLKLGALNMNITILKLKTSLSSDQQNSKLKRLLYVCPETIIMSVLDIEASKPPRNDLKVVSATELTHFYDARWSFYPLRPIITIKLPTQSAEKWIYLFTTLSWFVLYRSLFSQRG